MKRLSFLLFGLLISTLGFSQAEESEPTCFVSKKGIYYSPMDKESHIYIRFAEGDTVLTTSSDIDYDLAAKYLIPSNSQYLMTGKYWVNDNRCMVRLKAKNEWGKVKMEGFINDDKLILTVTNKEDNTARDFVFEFYPEL